jgi:hypothetical protein
MQKLKLIISILTCITMGGLIVSWGWDHDQSFAKKTSIIILEEKINQIQLNGLEYRRIAEASDLEKRIWDLKLQFEGRAMPKELREYLYQMESRLRELRRK